MKTIARLATLAASTGAFLLPAVSLQAMPNFARKYDVDCTVCHTTVPRLNEFGFQFRKAGFRGSDEIGKDVKTEFKDTMAARIQVRYDYKSTDNGASTNNSSQLTFQEVTLYPLTMSFGEHYGSLMELSFLHNETAEIENAYFRYTTGGEDQWFTGRVGIFHPFEGYGASDRPYSLSRPLIQGMPANHNGSTYFKPWGFDQSGIELAYVYNHTTFSATMFNGLFVDSAGGYSAHPAAGGDLKKMSGFHNENTKDFQLMLTHALKDDGSGLSLYYYHGSIDLPIPGTTPADFGPSTSFANDFTRLAVYANYRVVPTVDIQGGYQTGQDHYYDTSTGSSDNTFNSDGYFMECDLDVHPNVTTGARYDWFDPSNKKGANTKNVLTVYANVPMNDGLQFIAEYQHSEQERGASVANLKTDTFQIRGIWIF